MMRLFSLTLLLATASAFVPSHTASFRPAPLNVIISENEAQHVMKTAGDCLEGECSVDEVSELLSVLKKTEGEMESRMQDISIMISKLEGLNKKGGKAERDELQRFVQDLFYVFNQNKPIVQPFGWSGEVGDGPMTAYDALPPKKWTNPEKL